MKPKKILLTGRPGCGKTTLIKRIVEELAQPAAGFYTEEIRHRGVRVGFQLVTLEGEAAVLAHVDFKAPERLGKYGLDLSALESVAVKAVRAAVEAQQLVVIDEIGPIEIRSAIFRAIVNDALESEAPMLATISARPLPFINVIRSRSDVLLIEVRPGSRDRLIAELSEKIQALSRS